MTARMSAFSRTRAYFWPIHNSELPKFLPLFLLAFFIGLNYNILRNLKEAPLVTREACGAEVLPFLKVWGILPGAFFITYIYSRLNNKLSRDRVFYAMISIFLCFFAFFTFVIYPMGDLLHPHALADFLQELLPAGCRGMIAMFRYWTFSSFYVMSELWSSTILSMLFWGVANEITKWNEAKRFYGVIAISLNLATIFAGQIGVFCSSRPWHNVFSFSDDPWEETLVLLTCTVLISGMLIMFIYRFLSRALATSSIGSTCRGDKIRMSLRENFAYLARSKYLIYIAIIVVGYNLVINMVEIVWKDQVKQLYPLANSYNAYMSQITTITGIISFLTSIFISGQLIRRWGWSFSALITPVLMLISTAGFFIFLLTNQHLGGSLVLGLSPLVLAVFFGTVQNCLCRAAKFTVFDGTKEMAFIPLNRESRLKGKAAIDGVGSRLGKSGGSIIHSGLLLTFASVSASVPLVAIFLLIVIVIWIWAVAILGKKFNAVNAPKADGSSLEEDHQEPEKGAEIEEFAHS